MFGLDTKQLILILVIVVILFGARKLPELAKSLISGKHRPKDSNVNDENNETKDKIK